jgi:hypothetical protein
MDSRTARVTSKTDRVHLIHRSVSLPGERHDLRAIAGIGEMIAPGTVTGLASSPLEICPRVSQEDVGVDRVGPMLGLDAVTSRTDGLTEILATPLHAPVYALIFGLSQAGQGRTHADKELDHSPAPERARNVGDSNSHGLTAYHDEFPRGEENSRSLEWDQSPRFGRIRSGR